MTSLNTPPFVFSNTDDTFNTDTEEITSITTRSATLDFDGLKIDYDRTTIPKQFSITPNGVNWRDGTNNYLTGLERLALVQTAFQAVELPPNATTLKLNDTLLLDNGSASTTISSSAIAISNPPSDITGSYTGNGISLLTDATSSSIGSAGITASAINSSGTLISSLGGDIAGVPSPPYPAPTSSWSLSVNSGTSNPALSLSKSAPFTNDTTMTLDLNNLTHNQGTGSVSPDDNFTISTNKNLILTADNVDLSSTGRLIIPSLASADYLDYNAGTLKLKTDNVGHTIDQLLLLENANTTAGSTTGVPSLQYYKSGRNAVATDIIGSHHFYANNYTGTKTQFAKIETAVRNTAVGNDDGSISFFALLNGSLNEYFRMNGADSENNSYAPLDMNNNSIKSSTGNLTLDTTASTGTGTITLAPKGSASVIIPSSADANDFIRLTPNSTTNTNQLLMSATDSGTGFINTINLINSQNAPYMELKADFGGAINKSIQITADGTTNYNKITAYDGQSNNPFQIDTSGYANGSIEFIPNTTNGDIIFTGANLEFGSAGANSGQHLRIKLNGTYYKIKLESD